MRSQQGNSPSTLYLGRGRGGGKVEERLLVLRRPIPSSMHKLLVLIREFRREPQHHCPNLTSRISLWPLCPGSNLLAVKARNFSRSLNHDRGTESTVHAESLLHFPLWRKVHIRVRRSLIRPIRSRVRIEPGSTRLLTCLTTLQEPPHY